MRRPPQRPRTTPSWSRTGTPSLVSHTSLSRPVAPSRRASVNASRVFSGAWARAPRWAKATGGSSSEGRRCCTPAQGRGARRRRRRGSGRGERRGWSHRTPSRPGRGYVDSPRVQRDGWRAGDHPARGPHRAGAGEAARCHPEVRPSLRRAAPDELGLPGRAARRARGADAGDARHDEHDDRRVRRRRRAHRRPRRAPVPGSPPTAPCVEPDAATDATEAATPDDPTAADPTVTPLPSPRRPRRRRRPTAPLRPPATAPTGRTAGTAPCRPTSRWCRPNPTEPT